MFYFEIILKYDDEILICINIHERCLIIIVKAIDGDRGIDNRIVYSITRGGNGMLQVEPNSGIVFTTGVLDREDPNIIKTGAIIIEIMVF